MIIFWGLIIWGVVALIRHGGCCGHKQDEEKEDLPTSRQAPLDILKERYAKGEINKQEFEEKKKDLNK